MAARESEGLIPVEADTTQNQAVSPLTPPQQHHTGGTSNLDTISPEPTGTAAPSYAAPSYEKSQQLYSTPSPAEHPAIQPAEPVKTYPGQPRSQPDGADANQHPVNSPSEVKAYPGQPTPQQGQQHPQQYYTPFGQPSGYATATPLHALQSAPAPVDCPCCGRREMTRTAAVSGGTTHGWAAILCFCCCLGCIPYLMSSLKDVDHHCGSCGAKLACWHNSGRVEVMQNGARK